MRRSSRSAGRGEGCRVAPAAAQSVSWPVGLGHASPDTVYRAPALEASDADLERVYAPLGQPIAVCAHIHRSYIRSVSGMIVANTGSVSLSYDGDHRAAYLLLDEAKPGIRRLEYDVDKELKALAGCGLPHADWVARMLENGMPAAAVSLFRRYA